MNDAKQERLVRFMLKHDVSARCGARLVGIVLKAHWAAPLTGSADLSAVDWFALNPPLDQAQHEFTVNQEKS